MSQSSIKYSQVSICTIVNGICQLKQFLLIKLINYDKKTVFCLSNKIQSANTEQHYQLDDEDY